MTRFHIRERARKAREEIDRKAQAALSQFCLSDPQDRRAARAPMCIR